jgi:hypothetical protein
MSIAVCIFSKLRNRQPHSQQHRCFCPQRPSRSRRREQGAGLSNYFEATRNIDITREKTRSGATVGWRARKTRPVHHNMYYGIAGQNTQLMFGGKSFSDWQAAGQDADSIVGNPGLP